MLQNSTAYIRELLSFVRFNVSVLFGVPLPEAELMIVITLINYTLPDYIN
jgi:hypothetical protein